MSIKKTYLKTWHIGFYNFQIFEINADGEKWLEASPMNHNTVTRTAESEAVLRIILENDVRNALNFYQKVR